MFAPISKKHMEYLESPLNVTVWMREDNNDDDQNYENQLFDTLDNHLESIELERCAQE
jgi:hypothetical protein